MNTIGQWVAFYWFSQKLEEFIPPSQTPNQLTTVGVVPPLRPHFATEQMLLLRLPSLIESQIAPLGHLKAGVKSTTPEGHNTCHTCTAVFMFSFLYACFFAQLSKYMH